MGRLRNLALAVVGGLPLVMCGACGSGTTSDSGPNGTLTIANESGGQWTCDFNPFNSSVNYLSVGDIYEPLLFMNSLRNAQTTPWLATDYVWSNNNRTVTFTVRDGVKWNDGQPMTPADVLFAFNYLKKNPAIDINSIWSVLEGVSQQGSDQIVVNFRTAAVPYLFYIGDQLPILPQHIWSSVRDPAHFTDASPVGTGAYVVNACTPQNITFTSNSHYWRPGLPKVTKIRYPAFTANDPANNYLATGQAQWGSQFIPNIDAFYARKSPDHHYWFPPIAEVALFPNETVAPLNDPVMRRALAYATDRDKASSIGEYGYQPAANQLGIVTPTFSSWLDPSARSHDIRFDPGQADRLLESAGYHKGSDGIYVSPAGRRLSFHVINQSGYSDWIAALQVVTAGMKRAGIELISDNLSTNDYFDKLYNGNFDIAYYSEQNTGPTPYYELRDWMYSANSAPVGQSATTNIERYRNQATDALLDQFGGAADPTEQKKIMGRLERVMLNDIPVIPVTEAVDWYQYDTAHFTGWVTQQDQYALPSAYQYPDWGQVLLRLQPS